MSRKIMRVPLDFTWPLKKVWHGYQNPHYADARDCPFCGGTEMNPATRKIADDWYAHDGNRADRWCSAITQDEVDALVAHGRLYDFTHTFVPGTGWRPKDPPYVPTAAEVNAWNEAGGMGHDGINRSICVETRAKRLGVYGPCDANCDQGRVWRSPAARAAYEAWAPFEPPTGPGYQLWETTSEGSPVSPVFEAPEALARYLADNRASTFGAMTTTYERWLAFIVGPGESAGSFVTVDGSMVSGVDVAAGGGE